MAASKLHKARLAANREARATIVDVHRDEYDELVDQYMTKAGFVARPVTKVTWEEAPTEEPQP